MAKVIKLKQSRLTTRMVYSRCQLSARYTRTGYFTVFRDTDVLESSTDHFPGELLAQGGEFDRFHNKSVQNVQFKGTVYPVATSSATAPTILSPGTSRAWKVYHLPFALRRGSMTHYVIEPECDALWANLYPGSYCWSIEVTHMRALGNPGQRALFGYSVLFFLPSRPGAKALKIGFNFWNQTHLSIGDPALQSLWRGVFDDLRGNLPEVTKGAKSIPEWALEHFEEYSDAIVARIKAIDISIDRAYDQLVGEGKGGPSSKTTADFSGVVQADFVPFNVAKELPWQSVWNANPSVDELSLHAADVVEAYNAYDSNLLAYAGDLRKAGDTARELLKLVKGYKNPKAWASAWLSLRYGDTLMVQDTRELFESVARELGTRAQFVLARRTLTTDADSAGHSVHIVRTSTLIATNESYNDIMTAINNLMRWDAWPTLENTWDMIPLSFVVDWFLPVQDLLGQIDTAVQAPYIKPLTQYIGQRNTLQVLKTTSAYQCQGELVYYRRCKHPILSDIRPFTVKSDLPSFSVIHAGDALALTTTLRGHR